MLWKLGVFCISILKNSSFHNSIQKTSSFHNNYQKRRCEIIYVLVVSNPAYKSRNDLVSSNSLVQENLQELVMTERIESVIPVTYILTFLMAYYGPNAKILGNIKLTLWQYQSVTDIEKYIKNLCVLTGIDFLSFATNGILLWTTCKINIFKVLQKVQQQFWLIFAIQEAFLFFEVKFE